MTPINKLNWGCFQTSRRVSLTPFTATPESQRGSPDAASLSALSARAGPGLQGSQAGQPRLRDRLLLSHQAAVSSVPGSRWRARLGASTRLSFPRCPIPPSASPGSMSNTYMSAPRIKAGCPGQEAGGVPSWWLSEPGALRTNGSQRPCSQRNGAARTREQDRVPFPTAASFRSEDAGNLPLISAGCTEADATSLAGVAPTFSSSAERRPGGRPSP